MEKQYIKRWRESCWTQIIFYSVLMWRHWSLKFQRRYAELHWELLSRKGWQFERLGTSVHLMNEAWKKSMSNFISSSDSDFIYTVRFTMDLEQGRKPHGYISDELRFFSLNFIRQLWKIVSLISKITNENGGNWDINSGYLCW